MGGWTFALGKDNEQTLEESVPAGVTTVALAGADAIFEVGNDLFISESAGDEAECLGVATEVTSASVSFSLAVQREKDVGAKLWRPATSQVMSAEVVFPIEREVKTGVSIERSLGGTNYAIRTAARVESMTFELDELTPLALDALILWIEEKTDGGLLAFTLVEPNRKLTAVRLSSGRFEWGRAAGGRRRLKLPLLIEAEGEYR